MATADITNISLNEFAQQIFQPFLAQEGVTEIAINRQGELWYEEYGGWHKHSLVTLVAKITPTKIYLVRVNQRTNSG